VEVVKLLLSHPDVAVSQAEEVRGRGGASRESEGGLGYTPQCCGGGRITSQPRGRCVGVTRLHKLAQVWGWYTRRERRGWR
jgi:hypothetical protein